MKILIFSCGTGEGHNSAAYAICEELDKRGIEYVLKDPRSFKKDKKEKSVKQGKGLYNKLIKYTPRLFGVVYNMGRLYEKTKMVSPIYGIMSTFAVRAAEYIEKEGITAVICTHLFGMELMTAIYKKKLSSVPCYGVLTDYVSIPFTRETDLTGYFVPHVSQVKEMTDSGYDEGKIFVSGIPTSKKFSERLDKKTAREKLGIDGDKKVVLIMSGGVGSNKTEKLCDEAAKVFGEGYIVYVLVGRNEKLKEKVKGIGKDNFIPVSFTKEVNVYMFASDVMISKAGGLSSTEAAVANVALVHLRVIPGCETKNANLFEKYNMSVTTKSEKEAVVLAKQLCEDEARAERIKAAQRQYINPHAAEMIVDTVLNQGR